MLAPLFRRRRHQQPQAPGLGAGQRDHGPARGVIMLARAARARCVSSAGQAMVVKAVEPGPDPEGRESDLAGHSRDRLPVGTGPNDLGALHQPMGRRARLGQSGEFVRFLSGQRADLDSHETPSKSFLEGV
jgi:hypothetical protein